MDNAGLFDISREPLSMRERYGHSLFGQQALVARRLVEAGVFVFPAGNDRSVLQCLPPLVISDEETTELVRRLRSVLSRA